MTMSIVFTAKRANVKTRVQGFCVLAQSLNDKSRTLRHDTRGLGQGNNDQRQKAKG